MTTNLRIQLAGACLALVLVGCASTKGGSAAGGVSVAGPRVGDKGSAPQISTRAKLLFEDAVKASEALKRGRGDYASVERKFKAASAADPHLAEADYNLGVLAERQGKVAEAVGYYKEALRKKPTLRQAAENLGVIAQNRGDEDGAIRIYQNILENYPEDASSRARLAEIYRRRGDHQNAIEFAREALFRDPRTLPAYKAMMLSYYDQKQLAMAKLVALRAMKLDENDPELYHTMGLVLLAEKEPSKALVQFKKAISVRPDYLPSHVTLARMALDQSDYAGAEEHLRRILQAGGKSAEVHVNLGVAYKGMGQYDKAMMEYDVAQKLNPNLAAIYLNRGILLAQAKNAPDKALVLYRQFLQLSGGDVAVSAEHPVFGLMRDAEAAIARREEDQRAAEMARQMEEEAKRKEAEAAAVEKKQKDAALREQLNAAKGKGSPAVAEATDAKADCLKRARNARERKACEGGDSSETRGGDEAGEPIDGL